MSVISHLFFKIYVYLGFFIILVSLSDPNGGLLDIPISFILKNDLRMTSQEVATFRFFTSVPLYVSFLFGLCRDAISANKIRDREIIAVFSIVNTLLYVLLAAFPISYWMLALATTLTTTLFLFIASAQFGLTTLIAQQNGRSGEISAIWNIFSFLPAAGAFIAGGFLSQFLETKTSSEIGAILFSFGALLSFSTFLFSMQKARYVFDSVAPEGNFSKEAKPALGRLFRHPPIYPALSIWLLWNFSPGAITPLQYFLQNKLGAMNADWGIWNGVFTLSFIPAFIFYGFLSRHITFKALLWTGTLLAVPQFVPLLFVKTIHQGLLCAMPIGLLGGIATAAYLDLIIRSCPRGLQGTMLMMSGGIYFISTRCGDVLGTYLFERFDGFGYCVLMMSATYSIILCVLPAIPKATLDEKNR